MSSGSEASGIRVTIHQPEFLPWLGFFHKMSSADVFVLLDTAQFKKGYFDNRNRIRTSEGWTWLTVPVLAKGRLGQPIQDVEIDAKRNWQAKHWRTLQHSYGRAAYFSRYREFLEETYVHRSWSQLIELNIHLIRWGASELGLNPEFFKASDLGVGGHASDLLLGICRKLNAKTYLSGISGKEYLDENLFLDTGIAVEYQKFYHPIYQQLYNPFEPTMAVIDLLLNYGPEGRKILLDPRTERLQTIFT